MAGKMLKAGALPVPCCPRCGKHMAIAAGSGATVCHSCRQQFSYVRFEPHPEAGPVPLPASAGAAACVKHARNAAVASCERCGGFACELCRINADGRTLCPSCFDRLAASGELPSARNLIRNYGGQSLGYGIGSLLFPMFGILLAPVAIWAGWRGRAAERSMNERLFGWRLTVGMLCGAAAILIWGGLLLALLTKAFR